MSRVEVVSTADAGAWNDALCTAGPRDFYHTAAYHQIAEERGEGSARLFVLHTADRVLALPLLLRPLAEVPGLGAAVGDLGQRYDVTSVYGYAGPVGQLPAQAPSAVTAFQTALRAWLGQEQVVALFTRLHPLLHQEALLAGLGNVVAAGQTVSIDLKSPEAEQVGRYRKSHRYEIQKARRAGLTCVHDTEGRYLHEFAAIYRATMQRVQARGGYYFDDAYFERLWKTPELGMQLFVAQQGETVAAAALFARCGAIVQYHLAGTRAEFAPLAPMKLIVDAARQWACTAGATMLHLGGGVGSERDSLFAFKAGFGGQEHPFQLWRWVCDSDAYAHLCRLRFGATVPADRSFFPLYRVPELGH